MLREFNAERFETAPSFGTRDPEQDYVERPGAYVVLFREDGLIAVVRTPQGIYLPGGGHQDGESPTQAATREVLEECGLAVELGDTIGLASEFLFSAEEDRHFAKRCSFFRGRALEIIAVPEAGHETYWCTFAEASAMLTPESHRWAVAMATKNASTLFESLCGAEGVLRLAEAWHQHVLADAVVSHAFSHGFHPQHTERLAAYWSESWGGPATYSELHGGESHVVRIHSGNGVHEEMDRRAIACFDQAMDTIGLTDPDLRRALHDYFAWTTTTTMTAYPDSSDHVPDGLRIPRWSWDGLQP